jgi:transposase
MNEQGTSSRETAANFNIPSPSTLLQWKKQLETEGMDALELRKKGRPSMENKNRNTSKKHAPIEGSTEALQAENERLRMENEYLKKLNALVQNKGKSPNKTKRK